MNDVLIQGQEGQFRQIVEMAPYAIVMIGEGGLIEMVNRQAETIFGYPRSELLGQAIEVLLPEQFRRVHPAHRANFVAEPSPRLMGIGRDLFALRQDGLEFPVEIGLNPIETSQGTMVLASIVDITKRKRAEQDLRESEEKFRLMVDGVKDYAIFMIVIEGQVKSWNKGAEGVKGYRAEEVLGQPLSIFYT